MPHKHPDFLGFVGFGDGPCSGCEARPFWRGANPIGFQHWSPEFPKLSAWYDLIPAFLPTNPDRQQLAFYLTNIALRFLWLHEIAHILDGHLDYVLDRAGFAEIMMHIFPERESDVATLEMRFLEVVADNLASMMMLKGLLDLPDPYMPTCLTRLSLADRIATTLAAVSALCWFWAVRDATAAAETATQASLWEWTRHPSSIGRLIRIVNVFFDVLQQRSDVAEGDALRVRERLKQESEVLAGMDKSMDFMRVLQASEIADGAFVAPFLPSKAVSKHITDILQRYSFIYRFHQGAVFQ